MRVIADSQPLISYLVVNHGMTVQDFAKQASVNPSVIYNILRKKPIYSKSLSKVSKIIPEITQNIQVAFKEG